MHDASSSGRAAPRIKSINVHANLLSQRLAERASTYRFALVRVYVLVAVAAIGAGVLPWLNNIRTASAFHADIAGQQSDKLRAKIATLEEQEKLIKPKVEQLKMLKKTRNRARALLGQITLVLNSAPQSVALGSMRGDVLGGDLKLTLKGDAESFAGAEAFLARAKAGAAPQDVGFTSTHRSDVLAKGGVSFEFAKKVAVGVP